MQAKANAAWSVAERQLYEELVRRGRPYSREELLQKIRAAWSVAERQFYEGLLEDECDD